MVSEEQEIERQEIEKWKEVFKDRKLEISEDDETLAKVMIGLNRNKIFCSFNLQTKDDIEKKLRRILGAEYKDRVFVKETGFSPEEWVGKNNGRMKWANQMVLDIYKKTRRELDDKQKLHFSYIKFARHRDTHEIYGIAGCKSLFKKKSCSDLEFYSIMDQKKGCKEPYNMDRWARVPYYMLYNNLEWYTDEVLILKNVDDSDSNEAYSNELLLQRMFNLFD